jgi:hypothetical protein
MYVCLQLFSTNARHCIPYPRGLVGSSELRSKVPAGSRRSTSAPTKHLDRLPTTSQKVHPSIKTSISIISSNASQLRHQSLSAQASTPPSGWPRNRQYLPAMLCSWYKPVDWPVLSAHQVGVTNFQRLHASCACHSIATTCICGYSVLRQAQRVALPLTQSGLKALFEANQTCRPQCCLHEALPCRQP